MSDPIIPDPTRDALDRAVESLRHAQTTCTRQGEGLSCHLVNAAADLVERARASHAPIAASVPNPASQLASAVIPEGGAPQPAPDSADLDQSERRNPQ